MWVFLLKSKISEQLDYFFIINPIAGKTRPAEAAEKIHRVFRAQEVNYSIQQSTYPGEAIDLARKASQKGTEVVVAVGGDGTVNEVVNGIEGSPVKLGVIPSGTGNDFAYSFNIPDDIAEACRILLAGKTRMIDLGQVNDRKFINLVGVGFDGAVAEMTNRRSKIFRGSLMYVISVLRKLVTYRPLELKIGLDGEFFRISPMLMAVGICKSYGGGFKIVPDAVQDDGLFDICIIDRVNPVEALPYLVGGLRGTHLGLKKTEIYRAKTVSIEAPKPLPYHIEGEVFHDDRLEFSLIQGGIEVIVGDI